MNEKELLRSYWNWVAQNDYFIDMFVCHVGKEIKRIYDPLEVTTEEAFANSSVRVKNCMHYLRTHQDIYTLGELCRHDGNWLLQLRNFGLRNFGKKSLEEIEAVLRDYRLELGITAFIGDETL